MSNKIFEINIGLGDLFITRLYLDNHNELKNDLCISTKTMQHFRIIDKEYLIFLLYLIRHLFPDRKVHLDKGQIINKDRMNIENFTTDVQKNIYKNLTCYFPFIQTPKQYEKYIVFQTKVRIDGKGLDYNKLIKFSSLMKKFKTSYKIIIIGERDISNQVKEKDIHKITTIYDYLLPLKINNDVIDLSEDELIVKPDIKKFERDLHLIHYADMNVGFGWGGNFSMTWSVSEKFCYFIDFLQHPIFDFFEKIEKGFLYRDFDKFLEKISSIQ
jgi:hypothetical protein